MPTIYEELLELQKAGGESVLVTVVEKEGSGPLPPGAKMLVHRDGRTTGTVGGGELERLATARAGDLLRARQSHLQRYALLDHHRVAEEEEATGMVCGGKVTLFYEYISPGPHLYIFGGGHIGHALAYHLRTLPYYVTIIDDRPGIAQSLPAVARVLIADYETALDGEHVPEGSFFVIATPAHAADYLVLRRLIAGDWKPRYVGLLSSHTKATTFIRKLRQELGEKIDFSVLYTPVGLDLGGSSADEIAISVIAEIQAVRYGRLGHRHLTTSSEPRTEANPNA